MKIKDVRVTLLRIPYPEQPALQKGYSRDRDILVVEVETMREHGLVTHQAEAVIDVEVTAAMGKTLRDSRDFGHVLGKMRVHPGVRVLRGEPAGSFELLR